MKASLNSLIFPVIIILGLGTSALSARAQSATATISAVQDGANFDYTITLYNTDYYYYYDLNSFWYGWTEDGNNLPSTPISAGNSLGWDNDISGNSIMWINNYGTSLAPGQSATFTLTSADSPTDITTSPSGESVAYVYGIDGSQNYPGDSTDVFSPTLISVPEPSTWALLTIGMVSLAILFGFPANRRTRSTCI